MNAYVLARSAYAGSTSPVRTDRGTEYEAFSRCTHALSDTRSAGAGFPMLARALHDPTLRKMLAQRSAAKQIVAHLRQLDT